MPETSIPQPAPQASTAGQKKILIVEDERPLAHALEMKLRHENYDPHIVTNGSDAIKELQAAKYDLVLLDLIMPQVDGFMVLTDLKTRGITVPVIVLSNLGQEEDRKKAKELGAIDYFVKSNTPIANIIQRVKSVCVP
jgi:DNA-binding response OmpR family regulator